ncbi:Sen15 protein-domain-containing protein [Lipomyces japonicus]|uniref:Sen15 protein-domain-containing protein n=1 Tax=Lipomyces japonicus TaxID=56871 RepID=UPI0034CE48EC
MDSPAPDSSIKNLHIQPISSPSPSDRAFNASLPSNNHINADLSSRVKQNLDLHHLWTELAVHQIPLSQHQHQHHDEITQQLSTESSWLTHDKLHIISGRPPQRLYGTDVQDANGKFAIEWVLPARTESKWSLSKWHAVFAAVESFTDQKLDRVLMAMHTEDSTVVYYFVHAGLIKPRKNL